MALLQNLIYQYNASFGVLRLIASCSCVQLGVGDPAIVLLKQETSLDKDQKFPGRMQQILWGWVVMERKPHISFLEHMLLKIFFIEISIA